MILERWPYEVSICVYFGNIVVHEMWINILACQTFFLLVVYLSLALNRPVKLCSLIHAHRTSFFEIIVFTLRF